MAGKKYYAVKVGRETGIFTSWDVCKAQVQGYSGAVHKGFATLEEAQAFLSGTGDRIVCEAADAAQDFTQLPDGEMA
ncbi:MAG: RNase H1/viroplasmin domain-containing protein, partial [Peptococcaceae bacterium]|nr:RNase H1/viroplasmin domain-containing protein [Peptococcaceae bacterium]